MAHIRTGGLTRVFTPNAVFVALVVMLGLSPFVLATIVIIVALRSKGIPEPPIAPDADSFAAFKSASHFSERVLVSRRTYAALVDGRAFTDGR